MFQQYPTSTVRLYRDSGPFPRTIPVWNRMPATAAEALFLFGIIQQGIGQPYLLIMLMLIPPPPGMNVNPK